VIWNFGALFWGFEVLGRGKRRRREELGWWWCWVFLSFVFCCSSRRDGFGNESCGGCLHYIPLGVFHGLIRGCVIGTGTNYWTSRRFGEAVRGPGTRYAPDLCVFCAGKGTWRCKLEPHFAGGFCLCWSQQGHPFLSWYSHASPGMVPILMIHMYTICVSSVDLLDLQRIFPEEFLPILCNFAGLIT